MAAGRASAVLGAALLCGCQILGPTYIACQHNSDCPGTYICDPTHFCGLAVFVADAGPQDAGAPDSGDEDSGPGDAGTDAGPPPNGCTSDEQCTGNPGGPFCNFDEGQCQNCQSQPGSVCGTASDCSCEPSGLACIGADAGANVLGSCGCRSSSECLTGYGCDTTTRWCEPVGQTWCGKGCVSYLGCTQGCYDGSTTCDSECSACLTICEDRASAAGINGFNALVQCQQTACPARDGGVCATQTTACSTCYSTVVLDGGACAADYRTCLSSG